MSKFGSAALSTDTAARMTILHPKTGVPLLDSDDAAAWIELYGLDSERAQQHNRTVTNRRLTGGRSRANIDSDQIEAEQVDLLAALTAGWHLVGLDGAPLAVEHSAANARELYAERGMRWLREQVESFVANRANF